ncbi:hypothetical protein Lser_V15G02987 [Lactuca serriola]
MMMMMMIRGGWITRSHQSRMLSLLGEDSSSLSLAMISKGPSNVAKNLEEGADPLTLRLGMISKRPSNVAKNVEGADSLSLTLGMISKGPSDVATSNLSSGLSVQSSVTDGFRILQSKKKKKKKKKKKQKKRVRKTGEASQKLYQSLFHGDDRNLSSRHSLRRQLMDAESSGAKDSGPNTFLVTQSEVVCLENASIENVTKVSRRGQRSNLLTTVMLLFPDK